ncbi:hypothetical protein [Rhodophyticola porphyridii]|uniref:Uncharacterized protein n=1 Tax=Rhodophyticola porphyridii TaxID=1852017 RepID=A0A3L9Y637_9RHOB|nr:hypothetical protein [Rhodophyticola porphyridii]RMA41586.1 hypothetical protein D9R08_14920 [Rhodophyticola porphyridii]
MTISQPSDDFDYDGLSAQVCKLANQAIADGANPETVAAMIYQDSFDVAFAQGPVETLRHICFAMDRSEEDMRTFHERFGDQLDLAELVQGRIVPKVA